MRLATITIIAALTAACASMQDGPKPPMALGVAIAGDHRTPEFAARDIYRHPKEVLEFFGVQPDHTVVEVWPGGGWWVEILAPYLREHGQYYAAAFSEDENSPEYRIKLNAMLRDKLKARPDLYDRAIVTQLGRPDSWQACPPGTADMVLTFRNVHNWMNADYEDRMFQAFYDALKPGGVLGVVEHRAKPGTSREAMKESGYVTQAWVVEVARKAGFKLIAESEVNANPKDTADHPKGVWTLPPSLRLGEQDKDKYLAIGESDRMTLKFVKPILMADPPG